MKNFIKYLPFILLFSCKTSPIILEQSTLNLEGDSEKLIHFGFDEGDEIQFSFEEVEGKELDAIEIMEYPSFTRFSDLHLSKLDSFPLKVTKKGIYTFRFQNTDSFNRKVRYNIIRIPGSTFNEGFDSNVHWRTFNDTTYQTIEEDYLVHEEYLPQHVVLPSKYYINSGSHAAFKGGNSRITIPITLPEGTTEWFYEFSAYRNLQKVESALKTFNLAGQLGNVFDQTGALKIGIDMLTGPPGGDVCEIYLIDHENYDPFLKKEEFSYHPIASGLNLTKGIKEVKWVPEKPIYLGIINPDRFHGIYAAIEVVAIVHEQQWETRTLQQPIITSSEQPYLLD